MRVVIELVPRDREALQAQWLEVAELGGVDAINVPDIVRFGVRAHEAAQLLRAVGSPPVIPHIRAMDVDLRRPWAPLATLDAAGVNEVLVITGDPPDDMRHPVTGASVLDVIKMIRRERPTWRVYAALDPYRAGFAAERDYLQRKLDAGAEAVFTQPFFDLRLMHVWRDLFPDLPIYWGVTSVTSERAQRYWLTRNRAVFPARFEPTLAWHQAFAAEALTFAEATASNIYFMPIRVSIRAWLGQLLAAARESD
jgi:methylenetetrahydrofolate reductase (NADPH)